MADTPSSILLLRLQSTGSNVNLWGGYINTAIQTLEQASKGWQPLAVTGDATISWTNYSTGNVGQCAHLGLTGALTSPATLTFPSNQNWLVVHNNTGAAITIKCSGGTGVTIPNARRLPLFCNGTDYFGDTATYTSEATTLTNSGDLVSSLQLSNAISAIVGGSDGLILTSVTATQRQYLNVALVPTANGGVALTKINAGLSTEAISASLDVNGLNATTNVVATDTFPVYDATAGAVKKQARANVVGKRGLILQTAQTSGFTAAAGNAYPVDSSGGTFSVLLPLSASVGDCIDLYIGGTGGITIDPNGLKINGGTGVIFIIDELTLPLSYHSTGRGWV